MPQVTGSGRPCDILLKERRLWITLWKDSDHLTQDIEDRMRVGRTPAHLLGAIQDAPRSVKEVIASVDGWHPRHFGLLSEGVLRALANILIASELFGIFLTTIQNLLVPLIEKNPGRPIGFFHALFRVWARTKKHIVLRAH